MVAIGGLLVGFWGPGAFCYLMKVWLWRQNFFQNGQIVVSMTGRNSQGYKKAVEEKWWQSRGLLVGFWGPGAFCYLMKCGYEDKIFQNGQIVVSMTGRNSQGYKKAVEEKWWQSRGLLVGFWGPGAFCYLMKCGYEDKNFSEWPDCHFNDRPQLSRI